MYRFMYCVSKNEKWKIWNYLEKKKINSNAVNLSYVAIIPFCILYINKLDCVFFKLQSPVRLLGHVAKKHVMCC